MARKKKSKRKSFGGGKIKDNAAKRKSGASFGHLLIPKGASVFVAEPETKVVMDILPYVVTNKKHIDADSRKEIALVGEQWFKSPYRTHGNVGAGKDKAVCLASFGKKCPICEYKAKKTKEGASDEELKALKTSARNLYAIRVVSVDGKRVKKPVVQLFDFSDYLFQEMFESQLGDEAEFDMFPDLDEGFSVKVAFAEGSYAGHKYPEPTRFDFIARKGALPDGIEDDIPDVDKCLDILTYAELKEKFFEEVSEDDDEDEEEEEAPRKRKSNKKFVADDEDEEEDEDYEDEDEDEEDEDYEDEDEDDEEDEDEDEDDDEEDEDEDEDEEEEEEPAPKRKKRATKKPARKKTASCPEGYKFGRDYDKYDDCDDCPVRRKCKTARSK